MVRRLIRNQLLSNQLRVRLPCPPLSTEPASAIRWRPLTCALAMLLTPFIVLRLS